MKLKETRNLNLEDYNLDEMASRKHGIYGFYQIRNIEMFRQYHSGKTIKEVSRLHNLSYDWTRDILRRITRNLHFYKIK